MNSTIESNMNLGVLPMPPFRSESIQLNELGAALAKAQAEMKPAIKDAQNPFFKSTYADLAACWDCCRQALTKNNLSVIQTTRFSEKGTVLVTKLLHSSGQWIEGEYPIVPVKSDPQSLGSAITYARRYALMAIVGIAPEEDDGEAAMDRKQDIAPRKAVTPKSTPPPAPQKPAANPNWRNERATPAQLNRLFALGKAHKYGPNELKTLVFDLFKRTKLEEITKGEIQQLFQEFESKSQPQNPGARANPPKAATEFDSEEGEDQEE
jgi:hypothetical protein